MVQPENPPGFVIRTEAQKAASDNGFRLERGTEAGWLRFGSTTAYGEVWIAGSSASGPWLLAVSRPELAAEIGMTPTSASGPGVAVFIFDTLPPLYAALDRAYRLGISLPDAPLTSFQTETRGMPRTTEAERLAIQRVGQDIFRKALLAYWGEKCPLTGIAESDLLKASHIVPWAKCTNDAHRLDVHNGLLLSALWDAAFDAGLVSFEDNGTALISPRLGRSTTAALGADFAPKLPGLTDGHRANLSWHRNQYGF